MTYDYLVTGEMTKIRENGATSGIGVLATFGYDQLGQRTSLTRGNGTVTSYAYDPVSRLQQLRQDLAGATTANDLTLDFAYNPASQIVSTTRSNELYAWTGHVSGTTSVQQVNGLNQISNWTGPLGYDAKGNVTGDGSFGYTYSSENLLTSMTNSASGAVQASATYSYDPLMRLAAVDSSNSGFDSQLGYDGQEIVLEALSAGRTRRYVFGPGVDEPLVAYLVTSTGTSRSWYHSDERGSTIRQTNDAGTPAGGIGRYDEYGAGPGTSRFQYTGQYWLGEGNLHYYRARIYDPDLGRFLQPDPIGYGGGMNMYAYVGGDPVNGTDSSGTAPDCGLESNWRSGKNCADDAVSYEIGQIGQGLGLGSSDIRFATHQILDYLHGRISEANLRANFGAYELNKALSGIDLVAEQCTQDLSVCMLTRISQPNTMSTLNAIKDDPAIRSAIHKAFLLSMPWGHTSQKNEWGFWIGVKNGRYMAYPMFKGDGPNIWPFNDRPNGANIFFHTHPFTFADGNFYPGMDWKGDISLATRNNIMIIALSWGVLHWADYRR